jgi:IS5 family transposase
MIRMKHQQPSLWETLFAEEVADLCEPWMRAVDELLEDDELGGSIRCPRAAARPEPHARGRHQTPAEVVLRMLILKHVRNWSYETLEREVRVNVVYRNFCRIGMEKVPDAKTLVRLGQAVGPEALRDLHDRLVAIAQERKVIQGRKMRVDTTVVESNIHYPRNRAVKTRYFAPESS